MFKVLYNPAKAVEEFKKNRKIGKTIKTLIMAAILFAISTMINLLILGANTNTIIWATTGVFLGSAALIALEGWFLQIIMNIFSKKVKYYDTLTGLVNGFLIIGAGSLIAGLLGLIPMIGAILSSIILLFVIIIAYPVIIKTTMELTGTNMLTTIVALLILTIAIFFAAYSTIGQFMSAAAPGLI